MTPCRSYIDAAENNEKDAEASPKVRSERPDRAGHLVDLA
jgi:hypothetical protein